MLSILLYYSHFLTLVLLASLWSRKWQLKDFHQSTLVLLCLRISGNVLRITTFALSQWFQSDTGVGSWIPGFIQSGEFKCSQVLHFRNPYNGLIWAFHFGGIPQVYDVPFHLSQSTHMDEHLFPTPSKATQTLWIPKKEVFSAHYTLSSWLFVPELLHPPLIATNINVKFCITSSESRLC